MLGKKRSKVEFVDSKIEKDEIRGFSFKGMIDGSLITGLAVIKQLPFILFLVLLAIIYIGNRYHAEKMIRKINTSKEEVKNLRAEQITTTSELMNLSKPSTLENLVESRGLELKQLEKPPIKIEVEK